MDEKEKQKKPSIDKIQEEIKQRSERMVNLFNTIIDTDISDFPVPPFTKWLNGKIKSATRGIVEIELDVRPEMANPTKLLHGGMQSAILDDIIGMTCATLGYEGFLITIDFHIDFLGKARVGDKVRAKAEIVREGKRIVHAKADLFNSDGKKIATASSNLLQTSYKPDYVKAIDKS
ncbi:MAG: hotdog fold thioesterase [Candidatus Lokiarchaeota archaeon]|nr:hotdog fold thioesterase [Candidatus Lokiarchaeota archaeon]